MTTRTSLCLCALVFMIMAASTTSRNIPPDTTTTDKVATTTRIVVTTETRGQLVASKGQSYKTAWSGPSDRGPVTYIESSTVFEISNGRLMHDTTMVNTLLCSTYSPDIESGFQHTAFNLGYEAAIDKETSLDVNSVPHGALITLVQKGLQYLEMEANLKIDDTDVAIDFSFIKPFDLLTMTVQQLKQIVEEQKKHEAAKELEKLSKGKEKEEDIERVIKDKQRDKKHDKVIYKLKESATFGGPEPMDTPTFSTPRLRGVRSSDVLILRGHSAEVHACAWSPAGLLLASGSGDSTARIWSIADRTNSSSVINRLANVCVLKHSKGKSNEKRKDITTLDWNPDGTLLATGSRDGLARIWNTEGELMSILSKHKEPLYSVKWNKKGDYLLTGSFDGSTIAWDVNANEWRQQFEFHSGPTLDVDWRTNRTFASGSSDTMIYVCKIGENQPVKIFSGHKDEVNCVKWDPSGLLLASCSDDMTAKVWSMKQDIPIHDFKGHAKVLTNNDHASLDSTVKLWDVETGRLFHSLNGHRDAVFSLSFSPKGEYLASGSMDKLMNIWSVKDGKILKTYFGNGSISQVSWNKEAILEHFSTY
ncbi:hypothetical protein L1987_36737 [Smallanthus sonchifolius]|uniref:Uncharacterized protein n=1 Tax=Smallanthus sonchifolius TaxID=185202 RepID=A0ACB9HFS5_9ASTR|nr:hypothetical protein L1987_36737 [Smallanthus sonchifolius]